MHRRTITFCLSLFVVATLHRVVLSDDGAAAAIDAKSTWVTSIAALGSSDQFVAATADGLLLREATVFSFDASDPTQLKSLYTHPAAVWCVDSTSSGGKVASVDYRGNLVVFDTASGQSSTHEKAFERWCQAMLISPDDKSVVAGNEAGKVMVWDLESNKVAHSVELDGHAVTGLAISPDRTQLAASDGGGHVHLMKWPGLEAAGKIEVSDQTAWCIAYVDDGKSLLVGSSDRNLYRCEAKADAKAESVTKGSDWITQLAVSPAGQVAAAEVGGRLHFPTTGGSDSMDAASGVWSLCWNGDGQLFAGTRKDGIVIAGRTWKWAEPTPPAKAEPAKEAKAEEPKPEPKAEMKEAAKEEAPKAEAKAKPDDAKPAKEAPKADAKPAKKEKPAAKEPAAKSQPQKSQPLRSQSLRNRLTNKWARTPSRAAMARPRMSDPAVVTESRRGEPSGPLEYVVRFGSMRILGVMTSRQPYRYNDEVVARTSRGTEIGTVLCEATPASLDYMSEPTEGRILRRLSDDDRAQWRHLESTTREDLEICQRCVDALQLKLELVDVERLLGGERIVVYFLADGRVDFRQLVRDLAKQFQTRIEMRQIGVRDEAKLLADYGDCGQPICCANFLSKMPPVSMKMAKLQKATLDPSKISGRCGRLKCCLRYEFETYESLAKELPPPGSVVLTREGNVTVVAQDILSQQLVVKTDDHRRVIIRGNEVLSITKRGDPQQKQRRGKSRRQKPNSQPNDR